MTEEQRVRTTYDAFNARDERQALAGLHTDVRWDDGEGHMLSGKQAVAEHWREQWQKADAKLQIDSMERDGADLIVFATLNFSQLGGARTSRPVRNTIRLRDDLIASMHIS